VYNTLVRLFIVLIRILMGVVVILAISGFFLNFAPGNGLIFEAAFTIALIGVVTSIVLKFSKNEKKKYARKLAIYSIVLVFVAIISWSFLNFRVCGLAITDARNIFTNNCKIFSTTCTPPWYKPDNSCPGGVEIIQF